MHLCATANWMNDYRFILYFTADMNHRLADTNPAVRRLCEHPPSAQACYRQLLFDGNTTGLLHYHPSSTAGHLSSALRGCWWRSLPKPHQVTFVVLVWLRGQSDTSELEMQLLETHCRWQHQHRRYVPSEPQGGWASVCWGLPLKPPITAGSTGQPLEPVHLPAALTLFR